MVIFVKIRMMMNDFLKRLAFSLILLMPLTARAQENPIETISHDPGWCTIIHRWGFIGDSLCSGEHEYVRADGSKVWHDVYDYSWGQRIVAAVGGAVGYNFSQGGETAKGWIRNFWDYPLNRNADISAKSHPCQAYIMALGVNDKNKFQAGDAHKDIDLSDYTKNADTFAGYYGGIIQRVKTIQPDAIFFVVTLPNLYGDKEFSAQIRAMADVFENVFVIDLEKYAPDYTAKEFKERYFMMGHMNAAGYQWTAWMFMTYIDWIIENNMAAFSKIALMN